MEEPLSSSSSSRASYSGWQPFHAKGTAIFDLKADTERTGALYQVSFHLGDIILIQESCEGWYKGILARTGERGLFPENYVYVRITRETDRVKRELDTVLHEWTALLQRFYTQKQLAEFNVLKTRLKVLKIHNQILKSPDTGNLSAVKRTVMNSIEEGRRIMGLDVVVKGADDNVATEFNTPPFQLCKMHIDLADRSYYSEVFDPQKASSDASKANAAGAAKQAAAAPPTHHILMDLVVFQCKIPEPTELFFSIWDNRKKRFITEDYHVKLTTQGMPAEYNKIGKLKTIFKNINEKDITNDLFLVCRLVRTGKMLLVDNGAKTKPSKILKNKAIDYRRPFACGVLSLSYEQFVPEKKRFTGGFNIKQAALDNQDIIEHQMSVFTTSQETNFATLHQMIITNNNITPLPQSLGIKIGLCLLRGDDSDAAVTEHMQELEKDGISFTKKLAVDLGENRNEMYVTLDSTEVSQDRKRSAKNVEIIMSIRDSKGNILPDGICRGAGDPPASTYQSIVFYHTNTPKWDETVPILIPPTDITNYHLYFEIRHCSTKNSKKERSTFAFTFIRLTDEFGTVLADGEHVLPTFKPMKGDAPPTLYLTDSSKVQQRKGEMLKVNTLLCSTQISQNAGMLGLLNWNSHRHELANILNRFTFVSQTELMKFLPDIFEAMLAIWTQMEGTHELSKLVYDALVSVLGLFVDEKASIFTNFRPILAGIIERHVNIARGQNNPIDEEEAKNDKQRLINFANAHKHILTCIQQYFTQLETQPNSKITPTLKALEYSMKLLIASRQLYEQTNSSKSSSTRGTFKQQLLEFFNNFNALMKKEDPGLIGAQTLALKNFWYWFQDMNQIFAADEMSEIAASFLANLPSSDKKKLTTTKLSVIKELITSNIFGSHREKLVSRCATEVRKVMRTTPLEERDNCIDALLTILDAISTKKKGTNVEAKHLLPLLSDLMGTFEGQKRKQIEGQLFTAIAFLSILSQATEPDFIAFINTFSHTEAKKTYLIKLLSTMQDLIPDQLSCSIIPQTWQAICLFQYSTIRQVITYVTNFLKHNVDEMSKKGYEAVIKPQMEEDNHHLEGYAKLSTHKQAYLLKKAGANKRLLPKREWAIGFGNADADNHSGVTTGGDHSMGGGATGGGIGAADMEKKKSTVPSRLPAGASSTVTLLAGQGSSSALASSSIITPVSETNSFIAGQNKHSGDNKTSNLKYTPSTAALLGLNATAPPKKKGFFDARGRSMSQFHAYSRWEVYIRLFKIMTAFVTTRSLALEKFSESKRKFILEKYGDLRLEVAALMKEGWDEMGDFQAELISSFVCCFMELFTVDHKGVREMAMDMYFSTLEKEFELTKRFSKVERETILSLDRLLNEGSSEGTANFEEFFLTNLLSRLGTTRVAGLQDGGHKLVKDLQQLLALFPTLKSPEVSPEYDDERSQATCSMMEFLQQTERHEQYVEYVHQLTEKHAAAKNWAEAAFTLQLHANLLDWSDMVVPPIPSLGLSAETNLERKETLYQVIITYLDRAKYWERALELLEELKHVYDTITPDSARLTEVTFREAAFKKCLTNGERFPIEYFHVGYYGHKFPKEIRNKQFIHRASELERLDTFTQKVQRRWPDAKLMRSTLPPSPDITGDDGQHLQIFLVKLSGLEEMEICDKEDTRLHRHQPPNTHQYRQAKVFVYARPEVRKKNKTDNDFAHLWITNTYYETKEELPTLLRRAQVVRQKRVELPPIENAINTMIDKNHELARMIACYSSSALTPSSSSLSPSGTTASATATPTTVATATASYTSQTSTTDLSSQLQPPQMSAPSPALNVSPFTMVLKGAVSAAVNGGPEIYEKAFFTEEYAKEHPNDGEKVALLKRCLAEHIAILEKGLVVHQAVVSADFAELQDQLSISFNEMKNKLLKNSSLDLNVVMMASGVLSPRASAPSASSTSASSALPTFGTWESPFTPMHRPMSTQLASLPPFFLEQQQQPSFKSVPLASSQRLREEDAEPTKKGMTLRNLTTDVTDGMEDKGKEKQTRNEREEDRKHEPMKQGPENAQHIQEQLETLPPLLLSLPLPPPPSSSASPSSSSLPSFLHSHLQTPPARAPPKPSVAIPPPSGTSSSSVTSAAAASALLQKMERPGGARNGGGGRGGQGNAPLRPVRGGAEVAAVASTFGANPSGGGVAALAATLSSKQPVGGLSGGIGRGGGYTGGANSNRMPNPFRPPTKPPFAPSSSSSSS